MAREKYVFRDGKVQPWSPPVRPAARSDLPAPMIISDSLGQGVWNPADGRMYDSKSAYYGAVRDAGCEIAGNDSSLSKTPDYYKPVGGVEQDISQAIDQLGGS